MSTERGSGLGPGFGRPGPRREPGTRRSVLLPTLVTLGLLLLVLAIFTGVWTDPVSYTHLTLPTNREV